VVALRRKSVSLVAGNRCFRGEHQGIGGPFGCNEPLGRPCRGARRGVQPLLGTYGDDELAAIKEYRDDAYVRMQSLQNELGAPPCASAATAES
jgi:hypothetical protein